MKHDELEIVRFVKVGPSDSFRTLKFKVGSSRDKPDGSDNPAEVTESRAPKFAINPFQEEAFYRVYKFVNPTGRPALYTVYSSQGDHFKNGTCLFSTRRVLGAFGCLIASN